MGGVESENRRRARVRHINAEDGALIGLAAGGDAEAFAVLVGRHSGLVRAVASGILGSQEAEDACQEVWTLVWRRLGGFRGDSAIATWLYRVASNACLTLRRKDERRRSREDPASETTWALADAEDGPEATFLSGERLREARNVLLEALPRVREEHRAAFVLRHAEGLSYEEVAKVLGVPKGTAKGWSHRGRLALLAAAGAHPAGVPVGTPGTCPPSGGSGRAA